MKFHQSKKLLLTRNFHKAIITGICLFIFSVFTGLAQNAPVKGIVYDDSGDPAIGVSVLKKGTTTGVATSYDGTFEIPLSRSDVLVISCVGYNSQEITYNGESFLTIKLSENTELLDEVIVIGYGTLKKSDLTGAISSVNVNELVSRATTNPAEALQGKVSGVNIRKSGGNAGAGVSVKIRGVKSFGDNEPLYIIDGFPGNINNVNPMDIASLEVLKDGAAAAIYGSTAANGVILVTTKNGKKDEMKVDFNAYLNSTHIAKRLEMLDAKGYVQVHKQMYDNYNEQFPKSATALPGYINNPGNVNTDWQDEIFRTGLSQNYMISLRGGHQKSLYSISYNHSDDKGILMGNKFKQENARMKLSLSKNIFDVDANLGFRATKSNQPQYSLKEVYMITPLVPVYDDAKKYGYGLTDNNGLPGNRNPLADNHYRDAETNNYYVTANASLTVNFTKWLNFRTAYAYQGNHMRYSYHTPPFISDIKSPTEYPMQSESSSYRQEQVIDNILTFNKIFDNHSVNVMAGSSATLQDYATNNISVEGKSIVYEVINGQLVTSERPAGFLDHNFNTIRAGRGGTYTGDGTRTEYRRASFFGRLNYSYAGKYMLQTTFRKDGSSKFGSDSRWGFFPSLALGWRVSEEDFFAKDGLFNNLKLRASWGRLGNEQALGYYDFQALISTYNNLYGGYVQGTGSTPWPGSIAMGLANRDLQWETTDTKNIGFDYGLLNNKLTGSINYYYNKTEDMLITKALAPSVGLWDPILNVGKIRNTGIEFELNLNEKAGDFAYNIGLNFTTINNKVLKLSDSNQVLYGEGLKYGTEHFPTQTREGQTIAGFYLYRTDGIFQNDAEVAAHKNKDGELLQPYAKAGDIRFLDVTGDGSIDEEDKEYCGAAIPKIEANLSFGANYKGFDLAFNIGGGWGGKLYNANRYFYEGMSSGSNFLKTTLNAWTPQNTNTAIPRAILQDINGNARESDRFLEKGDYIRMRMMQIGYTIPERFTKKISIERLRFYASGENLFTITPYTGIDPEFSRSSVLNAGVDTHIYPFTQSYVIGLQLTF